MLKKVYTYLVDFISSDPLTEAGTIRIDPVSNEIYYHDGVSESAVTVESGTLNTDTDVSGNAWVLDEDNMASDDPTKVPTQQSVKAYVDAEVGGAVAGLYSHQGAYDAATNTPDLDTSPSGISKGYAYTVSVAGNFFTEAVEIGDVLIADIDNPTSLSDWTTVQKNIDYATTTTAGYVELATLAETDAGSDSTKAVTPASLSTINAHVVSVTNPHSVTKTQVGLGNVADTLSNFSAVADPTASDDVNAGYSVGSLWVNVAVDTAYICVDSTAATAVWAILDNSAFGATTLGDTSGATQIGIPALPGATHQDLQHIINLNMSSGTYSGGVITDAGAGAIDISQWEGQLRATATNEAELISCTVAAASSVALTDQVYSFISVNYNSGTPIFSVSTSFIPETYTQTIIGGVYRDGTTLHITNGNFSGSNAVAYWSVRSAFTEGIVRQDGGIISEVGTRNIAVTSGNWWIALNQYNTPAFDSSVSDTFSYFHRDGIGGWTETVSQTQIDNAQYDDGSGILASLSGSRYGVHWVYKALDSHTYVLYGRGNYTLTQAEEAQPPADVPGQITPFHATLIGKVIIQNGASVFTNLQNPFGQQFTQGVPSNHGDLGNLSNDDHTQYVLVDGTRAMTGGLEISGTDTPALTAETTALDGLVAQFSNNHAVANDSAARVQIIGGVSGNPDDVWLQFENRSNTNTWGIGMAEGSSTVLHIGYGAGTTMSNKQEFSFNTAGDLGLTTINTMHIGGGATDLEVYLGRNAGGAGTGGNSGDRFVAIGDEAGKDWSNETESVVVGGWSSRLMTGVNNGNTVVGSLSHNIATSGNSNTIIGARSAQTMTSGSSNIILGEGLELPTATTSNFMTLGDLVFGDSNTGKVRILGSGALTSTRDFEVAGSMEIDDLLVDNTLTVTDQILWYGAHSSVVGSLTNTASSQAFINATNTLNLGADSNIGLTIDVAGLVTTTNNYINGGNLVSEHTTDSTAVGRNAGSIATASGGNCTSMGSDAGAALTTGAGNTFYGAHAGMSIANGGNNTTIGHNALALQVLGGNHTVVGANALESLVGSSNNFTVLGSGALSAYTSGVNVIAIGVDTGNLSTSGNSNILIGHGVQTPTTTTSNFMTLGDQFFADTNLNKIRLGGSGALTSTAPFEFTGGDIEIDTGARLFTSTNNYVEIGQGGNATTVAADSFIHLEVNGTQQANMRQGYFELLGESYVTFADGGRIAQGNIASGNTGINNYVFSNHLMPSATGAGNNILLGFDAGSSLTTGDGSVAIGQSAAENLATAGAVVAIGFRAYRHNTSKSDATVIGAYAMDNVAATTGNNPTVIGAEAARKLNNHDATIIGFQAFTDGNNATGAVIIGAKNTNAATTAVTRCTYIGGLQNAGLSVTGTDNILLGYGLSLPAVGSNDYMSLGDVVFADTSTGAVRIGGSGVVSSTEALEVSGDFSVTGEIRTAGGGSYADPAIKLGNTSNGFRLDGPGNIGFAVNGTQAGNWNATGLFVQGDIKVDDNASVLRFNGNDTYVQGNSSNSGRLELSANTGIRFFLDATTRVFDIEEFKVVLQDAKDFEVGSTTGTKFGTANTQKIGFWNTTPVVQPTAMTAQSTQITFTAPTVADYAFQDVTNSSPWGFTDGEELRTFVSVVENLQTRVQELEDKLQTIGLIA